MLVETTMMVVELGAFSLRRLTQLQAGKEDHVHVTDIVCIRLDKVFFHCLRTSVQNMQVHLTREPSSLEKDLFSFVDCQEFSGHQKSTLNMQ